jgi:hypothetical protein
MATSTDLINRPLVRRIVNSDPAKTIRYWIVKRLNKRDICWAELVAWAEFQPEFWPPSNKATACMPGGKLNLENTGGCYCGKYSTKGRHREE